MQATSLLGHGEQKQTENLQLASSPSGMKLLPNANYHGVTLERIVDIGGTSGQTI